MPSSLPDGNEVRRKIHVTNSVVTCAVNFDVMDAERWFSLSHTHTHDSLKTLACFYILPAC